MTVLSRATLITNIEADVVDNSTGLVTPAKVRDNMTDTADSAVFPGDALTAGFSQASFNAGTKSTGTFTPDPALGNLQHAVNNGAHTLDPPASDCTMVIQYTNGASAGAVTVSGFDLAETSAATTTDGDDFFYIITVVHGFSWLIVKALQ